MSVFFFSFQVLNFTPVKSCDPRLPVQDVTRQQCEILISGLIMKLSNLLFLFSVEKILLASGLISSAQLLQFFPRVEHDTYQINHVTHTIKLIVSLPVKSARYLWSCWWSMWRIYFIQPMFFIPDFGGRIGFIPLHPLHSFGSICWWELFIS